MRWGVGGRLTDGMQYFASFGGASSGDPSRPSWWGDRLGYFPDVQAATSQAYEIYESAFIRLREFTVFKTHLDRTEFTDVIQRPTTFNIGVFDDGKLVAVSALDTNIKENPLLNPAGISKLYPDEAGRNAVFFCWYMAIDESSRRSTSAFTRLVTAITDFVAPQRGCVLFDAMTSRGKVAPLRFAQLIESHSKRFAASYVEELESEVHFGIRLRPLDEPILDLRDPVADDRFEDRPPTRNPVV